MLSLSESLLPLTEANECIPGHPSVSTVWRWAQRGVRGVRLETIVIGGWRYTSEEALARFIERLSATGAADEEE